MADEHVEIMILMDTLRKKYTLLQELYDFTKAQEVILNSEEDFPIEAFNELIDRKQERIDQIISIDDGFQLTYEKVRFRLEGNKECYKEEINEMKALIVKIGEMGIAITVAEEKNKLLFMAKTKNEKNKIKSFRKSKQTTTNYYNSMNNQKNAERSYFFDSKK